MSEASERGQREVVAGAPVIYYHRDYERLAAADCQSAYGTDSVVEVDDSGIYESSEKRGSHTRSLDPDTSR